MQAKEERYAQFTTEMEDEMIEVEQYKGRNFYEGPAVRTDEAGGLSLQDVLRATSVRVQWDSLGRSDAIVYPR